MKTVYLGLGSNLGGRLATLRAAVGKLRENPAVQVGKISSVYATKPVGVVQQPDFLNIAVEIATTLAPRELLAVAQRIERSLGRVRQERWGARTLDIDLLWYEGVRSEDAMLTLPHPRAKERGFVLIPWAEIAPELELGGESIAARAKQIGSEGVERMGAWERGGDTP